MQDKLKKLIGQQVDVLVMGDGFQVGIFGTLVFHADTKSFSVGDFSDKYISFKSEKVKKVIRADIDPDSVGIMIRP
jgi:hypothetical protein